jgi:hypothetical protein
LWLAVVRQTVDPELDHMHEVEMLKSLLLVGAYEAESSRPWAAKMREGLMEALDLTSAITDEWHRRRRARSWLDAGRAAMGSGDSPLAKSIAKAIAPDLRDMRDAFAEHGWGVEGDPFSLGDYQGFYNSIYAVGQGIRVPVIPDAHRQPEVVAAFDALLGKHDGRPKPRRRQTKKPTPPPE